ncbi:CDP-6-deoxy-delta-3,4-glucoseen reductase [Celeribacter indicus]|uniref:CDP-6-deoxy-delta-3,4-glucoseen reductase n=1 Tax=Celeribacter indicus TaxID=1208324 RepID=A0A0B5DVT9_9RHOB|nr:CDP-6-deoxy-delta-3,4-glucoseen reductase [Celeribacter indicus]AJE44876.1 CDP-6-deoxy-delta-3,4-glucoseen reductase [Celeribacter indicus]SDX22976.1 CDP-4-dehydro-6-deoxyglucose reductase [Celeribacter indicus]
MSFRVELEPSGATFEVEEGQSILNAALESGHQLAYSCRRGTCATCKCKITSGKVDYGEYIAAMLPESQKAEGYALLCQAKPLSDLTIEATELTLQAQAPKVIPCRVHGIERLTDDIAIVNLRLPQNEEFRHVAGQYVDVLLKDGRRRSYSIANKPSVHGVIDLELHLRHSPGGAFTDHVFSNMKAREILRFEGPLGTMFLREDNDKPIVFLASGTGFAPLKSIIEYALSEGIERPMTLYWGGRHPQDIYMRELAESWAKDHPQFEFVPVVSDPEPEHDWTGRTGFVHQAVLEDIPDMSGYQVYACGNPHMVDAARADFTGLRGMDEAEFFADPFTTEADLAKAVAS